MLGLTTDHKPDHPGEKSRIERCGGTVELAEGGVARVNGNLAVSRGFGDKARLQGSRPRSCWMGEERETCATCLACHFSPRYPQRIEATVKNR